VISSSQRLPNNTHHSQQIDIQAPGEIRAHNLSRRAAADQRLRPRGHSYRSIGLKSIVNYKRYKKMRQFSWSDIPREASLDPEDDGTALCLNVSDYQSKRHNGRAYWPNPHREAIQDECFWPWRGRYCTLPKQQCTFISDIVWRPRWFFFLYI